MDLPGVDDERSEERSRPRAVSSPLSLLFVSAFGSSTGFYLPAPTDASGVGAGALMFSTVAADLATPRLASLP